MSYRRLSILGVGGVAARLPVVAIWFLYKCNVDFVVVGVECQLRHSRCRVVCVYLGYC